MDTQKKRPMGYADLSIVQLKTFADRGDARAKEELAKRLGMNAGAAPSSRAGGVAPSTGNSSPGRTTAASHASVAAGSQSLQGAVAKPVTRSSAAVQLTQEKRSASLESGSNASSATAAGGQTPRSTGQFFDHADQRNLSGQTAGTPQSETASMSTQAAAALRQAEALLAAASPRLVSTPSLTPHGANLLINDAPGASGSMSPELLARLEEIARNTPDDDEPKPPVFLGAGMMLLGAIVALFGFSVTRGQHGTWYFVACGLGMAASGWLYFKGMKLAVPVYALTCAMAVLWAVYESPSWLEAVLRMAVPLLIAGYAFIPAVRQRLE